ncbi:NAD-dependent succinate-semialdehyde dehydrogenase [Mesorhizobium sp. ORS 3428]|uniref:NAD-dependent succinate-semialdehyde dehydrogenase n=1 Tax=Mesorhizobium sp. ORS 3428 TaxID=540997 RepID=UPI0008D91619|nr:NAD-dependent succinate-semialdehyde dehydrogenase [Mesorhizobium sp. ORS 3428]OHV80255.1 NAD-dependent succinate-semialdehyde dehydrogenase [Mesorhizobium sp. ORS 3428]
MSYPENVLLHIDGKWRPSASGKTIPVINPANEGILGHVAHADVADLDQALAAVGKGFAIWSKTAAFDRYKLMRNAADLVRQRANEIARIMTAEQGKALVEAQMETLSAADLIDWFAEEGRRTYGRSIPARAGNIGQVSYKEPIGPVAAFTPWNFPIGQVVRKLSAALASGCSIIVKAAEDTPGSPAELIRAFVDAGIPAGVINLVYGNPAQISGHLVPHQTVRKISFTGSTAVGKQLAALCGQHMKRSTMELGGHAPVIVLKDAPVQQAAELMARSKYRNAGQVCVSPTRFLIEEDIYDEFVDRFSSVAKTIKVGDGLVEGTVMGPVVNERRLQSVSTLVQEAVQSGAKLVTGGKRIGNSGYFYEPTVLSNAPVSARIMNDEPFGPVALMMPVSGLDAALDEANRLDYGLGAFGFTRSAESAAKMSRNIRSGMLSINHFGLALPEVPFGGINDSGYGTEGGADALEAYLNTKFVTHMQIE